MIKEMPLCEIWDAVAGYEGLYMVSSLGRLKSLKKTVINGRYYVKRIMPERILTQTLEKKGYLTVGLYKDSVCKKHLVHRIVGMAFIENIENKPCINHKDGVKNNNNVGNLEWCTVRENTLHAYATGMIKRKYGDKHWRTKYPEELVFEVKNLISKGFRNVEIEKSIGVKKEYVSAIRNLKFRIY